MISKIRIIAIVVCALMPIVLANSHYNSFDCTKQNDKNYAAWIEQGNKGTFNDMINACNQFKPIILVVIIPASPIIAFTTYRMTKPENFTDTPSKPSTEKKE